MLKIKCHLVQLLSYNFFKAVNLPFRYNYAFNLKQLYFSKSFKYGNLKSKFKLTNSMKYSTLWLGFFSFFKTEEEAKITPENLFARAAYAVENDNLNEAILLLNKILSMLKTQFESEEITALEYERKKARIYSEMANVYMLLHEINKASEIIIETMRSCFKADISPSHPMIIEMSLKLALIYMEQKKFSDAEVGFKFCIENCQLEINKKEGDEEEIKNLDCLLGMIYNYYSKFLYRTSKFNHALDATSKSITQALKVYDKNHPNIINLINDQAVIYMAMKNYEQARIKFQEAIDICLACPKDDSINLLPSIYANFGLLLIEIGDSQGAEEMCTNSRRYLKNIQENDVNEVLKSQINDCFMKLAGLKSMDRED